jgi:hypothetical protein
MRCAVLLTFIFALIADAHAQTFVGTVRGQNERIGVTLKMKGGKPTMIALDYPPSQAMDRVEGGVFLYGQYVIYNGVAGVSYPSDYTIKTTTQASRLQMSGFRFEGKSAFTVRVRSFGSATVENSGYTTYFEPPEPDPTTVMEVIPPSVTNRTLNQSGSRNGKLQRNRHGGIFIELGLSPSTLGIDRIFIELTPGDQGKLHFRILTESPESHSDVSFWVTTEQEGTLHAIKASR